LFLAGEISQPVDPDLSPVENLTFPAYLG